MYFQAVSGTGNAKSAFALELVALLVYVVYCYVVIELMRSDVAVCWTAEAVYAAVMVIMCRVYLWSGHWRGKMENSFAEMLIVSARAKLSCILPDSIMWDNCQRGHDDVI